MEIVDLANGILRGRSTVVFVANKFASGRLGLLPVLPLIGSITGIVTGRMARDEILNRPDQYSGDGTAKAAIILGWIGIGLALIAVALVLLFLPTSVIQSGLSVVITLQP